MKDKHPLKVILIISVFSGILFLIGISYAFWQVSLKQESANSANVACFNIEFTDQNAINLGSAYPISDEEGHNLRPYEFTIENTCDTYATYQVNLEELEINQKRLSGDYIKIEIENKISNLKGFKTVPTTINNADISHKLITGILEPSEEKTFKLRLWMDKDTPAIDEVMNASFNSKISITSLYQENIIISYLDNVKSSSIPLKEEKYKFVKYECNNNITLNWDNELWSYTLENNNTNSTQNVCNLYFETINYEVVLYSEKATFENNKILTNLIKNGSFENDIDNWESQPLENGGTISNTNSKTGNKSFYVKNNIWLFQRLIVQPKMDDRIYQGGDTYVIYSETTSKKSAIRFIISYMEDNVGIPIKNLNLPQRTEGFKHFSQIYTKEQEKILQIQIGSSFGLNSEGYIDDVYVINLTDTFGSGLEPTQEWVDKYIPYFDTTANIAVNSIEKLETKTFNYYLEQEAEITCTNAEFEVKDNTIILKNATADVYCKVS